MTRFELKNSEFGDKRLIIYKSNESIGYPITKQELYELYIILREEFKEID